MRFALAISIGILCVAIAGGGIVWFWRRTARLGNIMRRIAPAVAEWDTFEKLLNSSADSSHFLERHGPMTFEEEQRSRALTGLLPAADVDGKPVDAGRWRHHGDLLAAIEYAQACWRAGKRPPKGVFRLEFPAVIGDGFRAGSSTPLSTAHAIIVIRKGRVITAYPVLGPDAAMTWDAVVDISGCSPACADRPPANGTGEPMS